MTPTPRKPDDDELEEGLPAACRDTRRILAHFTHSSLPADQERFFRQHVTSCAACRGMYRATMAEAARVGHALRRARTDEERRQRHEELRRRALAATGGQSRRRFGLRLMLLPAAFVVLFMFWGRLGGEAALDLEWIGGDVRAAGVPLGDALPLRALDAGDWCRTGEDARARLSGAGTRFELGRDTQLQVETLAPVRLRLIAGELSIAGPCVVTCTFGALDVAEGRARLEVRGGRYRLECVEGEIAWIGPVGARRLGAGEVLGSDSPLVSRSD